MGTEKKWSLGNIILVIVCLLICAICLIPMLSLLARSLSSSDALVKHEVYLLPKEYAAAGGNASNKNKVYRQAVDKDGNPITAKNSEDGTIAIEGSFACFGFPDCRNCIVYCEAQPSEILFRNFGWEWRRGIQRSVKAASPDMSVRVLQRNFLWKD